MDLQQIEDQIKALEAQRKAILDSQRAAALVDARKLVQTYGFSAADLGIIDGALDSTEIPRQRRSKEARLADEQAKHEKVLSEARSAFEKGIQVQKFTNPQTGFSKYYWAGKKGISPNGEGVVVKVIEEIV